MGIPIITITSDGEELDPTLQVYQLEVRRDLNRVPEADLTILDGSVARQKFEVSDAAFFEPGKTVGIAVRDSGGDGQDTTIFEGLVVRHAVESRGGETSLRLELKDAAFKLTRQRKSAVFRDQSDDEAIRKLITDADLEAGAIEATDGKHEELVQLYASDWDFMVSRADAQGLVVHVDRGKVDVKAMVPSGAAKAKLEHGLDDVEIALELDASAQWAAVASKAWDVAEQAVTAPADAEDPGVTVGNLDAADIATKLGGDKYELIDPGVLPSEELTAWANARLARSRLSLLRGHATTGGRTDVGPLDLVTLAGVGERFNGDAMVSGITHHIDHEGWRTELRFGLSPEPFARQPDIAEMPAGGLLPPIQGLHVGVVKGYEEDPLGEHRVKVQLAMLDEEQGPVFARVARPDAGKDRGYVFWPEPEDEVIVGFVYGDPRQPIILGAMHGSKNAPPEAAGPPSDENNKRAIVSREKLTIAFDDEKKAITIETPGKNKVVIDDDAKSITLEDQNGNTITLDDKGITLKSAKDFTIDAASGKVVIKGSTVDVQ